MTHQWIVKGDIDFSVDIEIDGTPINQRGYQASAGGATTLITPGAGRRLKIYRATYTVASDMTGEVQILLGATVLHRDQNPKAGAMYGFNISPNFDLGANDEVLSVNLGQAIATDINVCSEEIAGI